MVHEILDSSFVVQGIYGLKDIETTMKDILSHYKKKVVPITYLSKDTMRFVSDLSSPPGLIAVGEKPAKPVERQFRSNQPPFILVLHQIQLPQNLGALIRTAEAAAVSEVWITQGSANPYGPKALRGSSGSVFRIPIRADLNLHSALKELTEDGFRVVGAAQDGKKVYHQISWRKPTALVMGSEGSGLPIEEHKYLKETIRIPMAGKTESLNVGAAAAVCLFEAYKQRQLN